MTARAFRPSSSDRIFDRFVRLDTRSGGAGPGLADRPMDRRGARRHARPRIQWTDRQLLHRHASRLTLSSSGHVDVETVHWQMRAARRGGSDARRLPPERAARAPRPVKCPVAATVDCGDPHPREPGHSRRGHRAAAAWRHDRRRPDLRRGGRDCPVEQPVVSGHARRPRDRAGRRGRGRAASQSDLLAAVPVGPKQLEWTLQFPFDAIWQRPKRVAAAQLNAQAVGERLVWDALTLVAQTRTAHADAVIAERRLQLTIENADLGAEARPDHRGALAGRGHQRTGSAGGAQRCRARAGRASRRRSTIATSSRLTLAALLGMTESPIGSVRSPARSADASAVRHRSGAPRRGARRQAGCARRRNRHRGRGRSERAGSVRGC